MKIENANVIDGYDDGQMHDCNYREDSWDDYGAKQTLCNADIDHVCPFKKQQRSGGYGERIYLCTTK